MLNLKAILAVSKKKEKKIQFLAALPILQQLLLQEMLLLQKVCISPLNRLNLQVMKAATVSLRRWTGKTCSTESNTVV